MIGNDYEEKRVLAGALLIILGSKLFGEIGAQRQRLAPSQGNLINSAMAEFDKEAEKYQTQGKTMVGIIGSKPMPNYSNIDIEILRKICSQLAEFDHVNLTMTE
jgi:hypothetical protein